MCDSPLMKRAAEKRSEAIFFLIVNTHQVTALSSSPTCIYTLPLPHSLLTKPTHIWRSHSLTHSLSHSSPSSSLIEMEDPSHRRHHKKNHYHHPSTTTTTTSVSTTTGESDDEVDEAEEGDPEAWATFNNSFRQVQSVLDRNRLLIQQVNENHQSRIPDNMAKNVSLIQELNGNISKVAHIYSDLNSEFTTMYQKRSKNSGSGRHS